MRGVGIVRLNRAAEATLALVADLVAPEAVERLPERRFARILDILIPLSQIAPFEASAEAKLRLALRATSDAHLTHNCGLTRPDNGSRG